MIVSSEIVHNSGTEPWGFVDVDVWIQLDTGEEWLYRVSKDLESGRVVRIEPPRYAETVDDDFWEAPVGKIPQEVEDFVAFNMAEILVKIGRAQAEYELEEA